MTLPNGGLHVGQHVIFHHNKRNEDLDALVLVIFPQNGTHPSLSLITVRPGERGPTVKMMIPHRDDVSAQSNVGYWLSAEELDA